MAGDQARRIAENQQLIRDANFEIKRETEELLSYGPGSLLRTRDEYELELFCACGRPRCDEKLRIALGEYEAIHSRPHRFVVAPEHAAPHVDRIVGRGAGFLVVEKRPEYRGADPTT